MRVEQHLGHDGSRRGPGRLGLRGVGDAATYDEQSAQQADEEHADGPGQGVLPATPASASVDHRDAREGSRLREGCQRLEGLGHPVLRRTGLLAEAPGRALPTDLGALAADPELAADVVEAQPREAGQQEGLALVVAELVEPLEHLALRHVEALLAVPGPAGVTPLRHRPGARAEPLLGIREAADLRPVVPRGDEGVADRVAGGAQVAGQRVGLEDQPASAGEVEVVEVAGRPTGVRHDGTRLPARLTAGDAPLGQDGTAMTDLLNRPSTNASSDPASRGLLGRALRRRLESDPGPRSLATSAAIAAVGSAAITLGLCMALALVGWYLADAGAHGQTTDALRVGTDVWLVGHGSGLTVGGLPLRVVPLTLTVVFALGQDGLLKGSGRIAVKVINHLGDEVMKVFSIA